MIKIISGTALVAVSLCAFSPFAESITDKDQLLQENSARFNIESSGSGITPPEPALGVYVVDQAPDLDTGCTFRNGGPLQIELPIPQVVNDSVLVNGKIDIVII